MIWIPYQVAKRRTDELKTYLFLNLKKNDTTNPILPFRELRNQYQHSFIVLNAQSAFTQ